MRSKAKVFVVLLAVISVEWVHANPPRSRCYDCENNSRGDQIGFIIDQHHTTVEGDETTGIKANQENVILEGGGHGDKIASKINQENVDIHGGSGKTIGIDLNQKNVTIGGGSRECRTSHCGNRNDGSGSEDFNGSNGSDGCGSDESHGASGCSRPPGTNTNRGPTFTKPGHFPFDTNGNIDDQRFGSPKPTKIQLPSCTDSPLKYCGIYDGSPVHARDCNNPFQKCVPSHTIPTDSRNPQFPNGGNGSTRSPNGDGASSPGQRFNGDDTLGSENGSDSTDNNDGSSGRKRYPSVPGKPARAQQSSCADRQMNFCGVWKGLPVCACDCDSPSKRCPPSYTRPTQIPSGGNGSNGQSNVNGAPAPGQKFNGDNTEGSGYEWDSTYHHETNTHHGDQQFNCRGSDNNCQQPSDRPQNSNDENDEDQGYHGYFFVNIYPNWQRNRSRSSSQRVYDDGKNLMVSNGPDQFVVISEDGIITGNN